VLVVVVVKLKVNETGLSVLRWHDEPKPGWLTPDVPALLVGVVWHELFELWKWGRKLGRRRESGGV
jgi:hypothetical protein